MPFKEVLGKIIEFTEKELKWAEQLRTNRNLNPRNREIIDTHRMAAYGTIDQMLEQGKLTPEEATREKRIWDIRHGY